MPHKTPHQRQPKAAPSLRQLTLRGLDAELERRIRELAKRDDLSLNQAALRLLQKGAGLPSAAPPDTLVGRSLDHLIGTWSEEDAARVMDAARDFDRIDEALWR